MDQELPKYATALVQPYIYGLKILYVEEYKFALEIEYIASGLVLYCHFMKSNVCH